MSKSHEHALTLLDKARGDRYVLEHLVDDPEAPLWAIGFHAQQAVEKALKAVLTSRQREYSYTHNLSALVKLLEGVAIAAPPDAAAFPRLTPFGAPLRYEMLTAGPTTENLDRSWARDVARRTLAWAEPLIGADSGPIGDERGTR